MDVQETIVQLKKAVDKEGPEIVCAFLLGGEKK